MNAAKRVGLWFVFVVVASAAFAAPPTTQPATRPAPPASAPMSLEGERVVFLFDGGGWMGVERPALQAILGAAIKRLRPDQKFNVLLTQDNSLQMAFPDCAEADDAHQREADRFLAEFVGQGDGDEIAGLRRAFALRPNVIVLANYGDFSDNDAALDLVRRLNPDRKVKIHTLDFDPAGSGAAVLRRIAGENGGTYRAITPEEHGGDGPTWEELPVRVIGV